MQSINNHIMRTECPIDMKQTTLEREFHTLSLLTKKLNLTAPQIWRTNVI